MSYVQLQRNEIAFDYAQEILDKLKKIEYSDSKRGFNGKEISKAHQVLAGIAPPLYGMTSSQLTRFQKDVAVQLEIARDYDLQTTSVEGGNGTVFRYFPSLAITWYAKVEDKNRYSDVIAIFSLSSFFPIVLRQGAGRGMLL